MISLQEKSATIRRWVKSREDPWADRIFRLARGVHNIHVPVIPPLHGLLYIVHRGIALAITNAKRVLWFTPLFQSRLVRPAPRLYLYGGLPLVLGAVKIRLGADCRVGGRINISGRTSTAPTPEVIVGDNCDIGWGSSLAAGRRIVLGNNVRLAANVLLAGYPGHPLDAAARARGEPDTDDQIGDIILEDDVWLATGTTVVKGVTIGRGTIVGAGSVVTHDLPPFVLAGGAPARIIRKLAPDAPATDRVSPSRDGRGGSPVS